MANEILTKLGALTTFTITLASLADGAGRSAVRVENTGQFPGALVFVEITSGGSAPTVDTSYDIYLLRGDDDDDADTIFTDNWVGTDAAFTVLNAPLLGTIRVTAATATEFRGAFDTSPHGPLGEDWAIAIVNETGQAISSTEADSFARFRYHVPEVQ